MKNCFGFQLSKFWSLLISSTFCSQTKLFLLQLTPLPAFSVRSEKSLQTDPQTYYIDLFLILQVTTGGSFADCFTNMGCLFPASKDNFLRLSASAHRLVPKPMPHVLHFCPGSTPFLVLVIRCRVTNTSNTQWLKNNTNLLLLMIYGLTGQFNHFWYYPGLFIRLPPARRLTGAGLSWVSWPLFL